MLTPVLIATVIGYLLGSLPFGYLVARAKGVNIFEVGSKNPGATNVRRVLGRGPGNLVLFLDALKGAVAAAWPCFKISITSGEGPHFHVAFVTGEAATLTTGIAGLVGALLGHSFSCFTKFRGGKGVATGAGGFLVLFPLGMLVAFAIFGATLATTRYVSLGSMLGAISLPITALVLHHSTVLVSVSAVIAVFVILRHRANILRLLAGTESKMGQKPAAVAISSATPKT
jgi:acyl phosphate:glycerol-3-phosphate acyltransferase